MRTERLFDVRGLTAIVTGGASGLGFAYAEAMADNGAPVTLLDSDPVALEGAVETLKEKGGDARGEETDVTDREALKSAVDRAAAHYGRLDVVFANAGIGGGPGFVSVEGVRDPEGAIENICHDRWDKVIATNLTSVFTTIQAAAQHMKRQSGGRIIVTTSIAAIRPDAYIGTPYLAAKAGAAHLVRQLALELARYNILVNAIAPGPFITNVGNGRWRDPKNRKPLEDLSPMHRMASTEEIQGLALLLASPAGRYVTGTQIVIDGGLTLGRAD